MTALAWLALSILVVMAGTSVPWAVAHLRMVWSRTVARDLEEHWRRAAMAAEEFALGVQQRGIAHHLTIGNLQQDLAATRAEILTLTVDRDAWRACSVRSADLCKRQSADLEALVVDFAEARNQLAAAAQRELDWGVTFQRQRAEHAVERATWCHGRDGHGRFVGRGG